MLSQVIQLGDVFLSQFPNKVVAQAACDVLQLLVSYWEKLQMFETPLPLKIAEVSFFPLMLKYKHFLFIMFDI